ncbi:resolvase [Clostridia bacterium]|nr:resolvase [Clostridia bacterium]
MIDDETPGSRAERKKAKLREKYQALTGAGVECIPARERIDFFHDTSLKRVVVYVRVSTDDVKQIASFELQKSFYEDFVKQHPNWVLVEIYADEGISGTSLNKRDQFVRMIEDCKKSANSDKKIDLVLVKSVSRFARNLVHCLDYVRQLSELRPPIGVYFEIEKIYTLSDNYEMALNMHATLAEHESRQKSTLLKDAYVKRSGYGSVWTPELLGYDLDDDDKLVINEEEAKTVRLIYFMYLFGYTCTKIAETLMELGLRTNHRFKDGSYNMKWSAGTVLMILQNERHCGEILTQKTWTPSFRSHKSVKNKQDLPQYRKYEHHEPIITKDDFVAVQRLISNAKYGNKGFLPELKVITEGALKGFVSVNPRWGAFTAKNYHKAADSVCTEENAESEEPKAIEVAAQAGDFDYRGYEVVRAQFFNTARRTCISFSSENLSFSSECIRKLGNPTYVEMLIEPRKQILVVRPSSKEVRNAVRWAKSEIEKYIPRVINGVAFLGTLFEICGWNTDYKYRVRGVRSKKDDESVIVFDMHDTEIFLPQGVFEEATNSTLDGIGAEKQVIAFPKEWSNDFGLEFYRLQQSRELETLRKADKWDLSSEGQPYRDESSLNVTAPEKLAENIQSIMDGITQGETANGN